MIFLDNIIFSLQKAGGISVVWENLIRGIKDKFNIKYLEYKSAHRNINRKNLFIEDDDIIRSKNVPLIIEQFRSPSISPPVDDPVIFHSSYYRTSKHPQALNITTVHDFIYELAQNRMNLSQKIRSLLNHRSIINSDVIVCISENTKKDLFRLIPEVKDRQVQVIYNGVSRDYFISDHKYEGYENYLLFVGGRNGYKNFQYAVEMVSLCNRKLLICGGELTLKEQQLLDKYLGPSNYKFVLHPSNRELNMYYNSVDALIYPSSYEGFGIPILEAQRAGCPVIALNISSIPEVIGETPLLMDVMDDVSLRNALNIISVYKNREEIVEAGLLNARRFSWDKMANQYIDLYKSIT